MKLISDVRYNVGALQESGYISFVTVNAQFFKILACYTNIIHSANRELMD